MGKNNEFNLNDYEDDNISSILADLNGIGDDATISIYKITNEKDKRGGAFLFRESPEEFNRNGMERIRDDYGGGLYRVHVKSGAGRLVANSCISIADPIRQKAPENPGLASTDLMTMFSAMLEKQNQQMMQLFGSLAAKQDNETAFLQKMQLYKSLFGGNNSGNNLTPADMLGLIQQGIDLSSKISGETRESTMLDVFKEFGPKILDLVTASTAQQTVQTQQAPQIQHNQQNPALMHIMPILINAANKNVDCDLYADLLLDTFEGHATQLTINDFMQTGQYSQHVQRFLPWFNKLVDTTQMVYAIQDDPGTEETNMINPIVNILIGHCEAKTMPCVLAETAINTMGKEKAKQFIGTEDALNNILAMDTRLLVHREYLQQVMDEVRKLIA